MEIQSTQVGIQDVIQRLHRDLPSILADQFGTKILALHPPRFVKRPYSTNAIVQVETREGTHGYFVKQIIHHPLNVVAFADQPDQASIEYRILEELHPRFVDIERCAVPRPIILYRDADAYVTQFVDARDLVGDMHLVHYGANRRRFGELLQNFEASGRWLRHFQGALDIHRSGEEVASYVLKRCLDRVARVEELGASWVDPQFADRARDYIESLFRRLDMSLIAVVPRHGDFGPWNTLANDNGITVIDFFGAGDGPCCEDLLSVLVWLDALKHGIANSGRRIDRLAQAFLTSFGPVRPQQTEFVLLCEAFQRLLRIVGALHSYAADKDRRATWPERIERRGNLAANVGWFQARPQRSTIWPSAGNIPAGNPAADNIPR